MSPGSSVVEHPLCKRAVCCSIQQRGTKEVKMNPEQRLEEAKYQAAVIMCWFLALSLIFSWKVMVLVAVIFGISYSTYLLMRGMLLE